MTEPNVPENLPDDATSLSAAEQEQTGPEQIGTRTGMFGARDTGDTSGFGGLVRPVLFPAPATAPYGGWYDEVAGALAEADPSVVIDRGEITFHVRREDLLTVARILRDELRFEF